MEITIDNKTIYFQVQYAKRKKTTLEITPEGLITVKAPKHTEEQEILKFVQSHAKTLLAHQAQLVNRKYISNKKSYNEDENFLYLGKVVTLNDILEVIPETEEEIQAELKKFYTNKTKKIVKERVQHYEKIIGVNAKGITVVDSTKTWGTCNSLKQLTFNYRLSMAPMSSIDYVVIHELCHILHLNHDRSFWRKVGMYDPDFKKHQEYLDRFGFFMTI